MAGRLLVLGASGQVAKDLPAAGAGQGFDTVVLVGRETADLTTVDAGGLIDAERPDAVVNAAAYTAVDRAEQERDVAFALNAAMPGAFAAAAAKRGVPFVHISTDYVFDGSGSRAYVETDDRHPLGVYGESKAEGEDAVLAAGGRIAILRTAWVYGPHGSNFLKTMIRLAQTRTELGVVADQIGCPTRSADIAEGAARVARRLVDNTSPLPKVMHCAGGGDASWADFAQTIFEEEALRNRASPAVRRIMTSDYPTPAARPANSRLDCSLLQASLGWRPLHWRTALAQLYSDLGSESIKV